VVELRIPKHRLAYDMRNAIKMVKKEKGFYAKHMVYSGIDYLRFGVVILERDFPVERQAVQKITDLGVALSKEEYKQHIRDITIRMLLRIDSREEFFKHVEFIN